eukprot:TRINITY_DN11879_c0_g2_i2.p1 TRINITY_DN11879_c0_g2~~TRINITY_DN11879_c0_g2_i2.p1  ORF type:complete len:388 (+),score=74.35 TRINITY_DN11879_c0_g2_i2:71-1234(+)
MSFQTLATMTEDNILWHAKQLFTGSKDETSLSECESSSDMEPLSEEEEEYDDTCMSAAEHRAKSIVRAQRRRKPSLMIRIPTTGRRHEVAVQSQAKEDSLAQKPTEHMFRDAERMIAKVLAAKRARKCDDGTNLLVPSPIAPKEIQLRTKCDVLKEAKCEAQDSSKWTTIIFDWDDTLFPTWFVKNVVRPTSPDNDIFCELQADSPFLPQLQEHARLVREVLTSASKVARVGIVTLAADGWVADSSEWYLPGLDLPKLLKDLNIRVYYARNFSRGDLSRIADEEDGVNMMVVAKQFAMTKCLNKIRGNRDWKHANVISIGDSIYDHEACRECMFSHGHEGNVCKTVKLLDDPTLKALDLQLKKLKLCLPSLVANGDDVDFELESVCL